MFRCKTFVPCFSSSNKTRNQTYSINCTRYIFWRVCITQAKKIFSLLTCEITYVYLQRYGHLHTTVLCFFFQIHKVFYTMLGWRHKFIIFSSIFFTIAVTSRTFLLLLSCLFNHHAVKLKYDIAVLFGVTQNGRASK